ncbi:hypothetical protein [Prosthecobacter sp.]|uniref:hypothetical protein n=1 Tax=Prosthecobacter sp. TaxID=1965333 RepID=UPI002ABB2857|nr:hypothetical protein [Prosthecobacter sp.]MDZ4401574.1 hypothetical protein [Prosthecobacter sp.]
MKAVFISRIASAFTCMFMLAFAPVGTAQSTGNCTEISNDVRVAVEKDPSKVLMVVEDALVINEGCAADIVKAAITASKADATLAGQIVQTAVSVAPKMAAVINEAAISVVPGLAAVAPVDEVVRPVTVADKNPSKNPVIPVQEEDFFIPASIRGVYLIQPPSSGPLPCDPTYRCCCDPVSPAAATP